MPVSLLLDGDLLLVVQLGVGDHFPLTFNSSRVLVSEVLGCAIDIMALICLLQDIHATLLVYMRHLIL